MDELFQNERARMREWARSASRIAERKCCAERECFKLDQSSQASNGARDLGSFFVRFERLSLLTMSSQSSR